MPVMLSVQVQRFKDLGDNGPDPLMRFPTPTAATKPWPGPTGPAAISLSRRPASTKSNLAITKIFPELTGKLNGRAVRVLTCRYCGAELKIIAFVIEIPSVRAILVHIGASRHAGR